MIPTEVSLTKTLKLSLLTQRRLLWIKVSAAHLECKCLKIEGERTLCPSNAFYSFCQRFGLVRASSQSKCVGFLPFFTEVEVDRLGVLKGRQGK